MSLIEGIGDEVTLCATVLVLATTLIAAWFSTRVRDRPHPRVRVIQTTVTATGVRNRPQQQTTSAGEAGSGRAEATGDESTVSRDNVTSDLNASSVGGENADVDTGTGGGGSEQPTQYTQIADDEGQISGAQSHHDVASRTEALQRSSDINDTTARNREQSVTPSKETDVDQEQQSDQPVLGESVQEITSPSLAATSEDELHSTQGASGGQETSNESVLRNRQTGKIYPTLPAFSSDGNDSHGAAASSNEASFQDSADAPIRGSDNVEDLGADDHLGEPQHQTDGTICIRVRFSNDAQRLVQTSPETTLGQFRR